MTAVSTLFRRKLSALVAVLVAGCTTVNYPIPSDISLPTKPNSQVVNETYNGKLRTASTCLVLDVDSDFTVVPIWPNGTVIQDGSLFLPGSNSGVRLGDSVTMLGNAELIDPPDELAACGNRVFNVVRFED